MYEYWFSEVTFADITKTRAEIANLKQNKLKLTEDSRINLMAWGLVQSNGIALIMQKFKAVENLVNYQSYQEAAPVSTLETALQIILLEFSEIVLS